MTTLERLDDYVRGHGDEDSVAAYEDDLFARALSNEAPELAFRSNLAASLRFMRAKGTLDMWLTAREVAQVRSSSLRTAYIDVGGPHLSPLEISADVDLVITKVPLELEGVESLEVEVLSEDGRLLKRMPDVAFDPSDGAIFACCDIELAKIAFASNCITRIWATDVNGRRLLKNLSA